MDATVALPFEDYERTVSELLDRLEVATLLAGESRVLLKPNLVTSSPPPVTTDARMVAAVARWCRQVTSATILVVEGSGEGDTLQNYRRLGYRDVPAVFVNFVEERKVKCRPSDLRKTPRKLPPGKYRDICEERGT